MCSVRVLTNDLTEAAISRAFDEIAAGPRRGVAQFVAFETLWLIFVTNGKSIREETLAETIIDKRMFGIIPSLRNLILTYLEGVESGEGHQPWCEGEEGVAALGHLLRTLMVLDGSNSYDVMRAYMLKRDGEHEGFSGDVVYPEMLRSHPIRSERDIQLASFLYRIVFGEGVAPPRHCGTQMACSMPLPQLCRVSDLPTFCWTNSKRSKLSHCLARLLRTTSRLS